MWIKERIIVLLSLDSGTEPARLIVLKNIHIKKERKKKEKRILEVLHLHIWEENSFNQKLVENAQRQL